MNKNTDHELGATCFYKNGNEYALEYTNGEQRWYNNGILHREDGPARIFPNGEQCWYQFDRLHREDGPAIVAADGDKYWYRYGKLHREDGPAVMHNNGMSSWYLNDHSLSFDKYCTQLNLGPEQKLILALKYPQ